MTRVSRLIFMLGVAIMAGSLAACEGPNWQKDNAGGSVRIDDWTPIEVSQLSGNLPAVLAGLPLKDAKRALRDNAVHHDNVIITERGFASTQGIIAPNSYFGEQLFSQLRSRDAFDAWARAPAKGQTDRVGGCDSGDPPNHHDTGLCCNGHGDRSTRSKIPLRHDLYWLWRPSAFGKFHRYLPLGGTQIHAADNALHNKCLSRLAA